MYDRPRNNVVIVLLPGEDPARWLRSTPNTYRVMHLEEPGDQIHEITALGPVSMFGRGEPQTEIAKHALGRSGLEAVFVGPVEMAAWPLRTRSEPIAQPLAAAVSDRMLTRIGGPTSEDTPSRLLSRIRSAGFEYGLVPVPVSRPGPEDVPSSGGAIILILAAVPMSDIGGGSRAAQLAVELLRRGVTVHYVSVFPSYETTDLGLRFVHPGLAEYRLEEFLKQPVDHASKTTTWVLAEVPTREILGLTSAQGSGWSVCYDIIDRWSDPTLGGDWYEQSVEDRLIERADLVVVSAPDLSERPRRLGQEPVLIPNGVDREVFGHEAGPLPLDFPGGSPVIGYHGSLYGSWLDWVALAEVARTYPDGSLVVIGDEREGHPPMPENVHFLGLKPQHALPDYLSRFDVGILPFEVSLTTHAVSPLKVFEYLASGVPVASPPLRSLEGIDGVCAAESLVVAVGDALSAPRPDRATALEKHGWHARVTLLLDAMDIELEESSAVPVKREIRGVVHYEDDERLIG